MAASSYIIDGFHLRSTLWRTVRPSTLIESTLKTGPFAYPRDQTAPRIAVINASEAHPLVAIEAKSHDLEGKDIPVLVTVNTLDPMASKVVSPQVTHT